MDPKMKAVPVVTAGRQYCVGVAAVIEKLLQQNTNVSGKTKDNPQRII
jgi:hypothetical protein